MGDNTCLVCESELTAGYKSWHLLCKNCGYEKANLQQTINSHLTRQLIDENAREKGLRELRKSNFTIIADLHYFNLPNLISFLERNKFNVKTKGTLPTIRLNGLYARISYDRRLSRIVSAFIYIGVALLYLY